VEGSEHDFLAFQRVFEKSPVKSVVTRYVRAEEALKRLAADAASFDLVVTDHKLPGISGLELCRELVDRNVSLPLVLMTGAKSESLQIQALKAGFDDFLIKDPNQGYLGLLPLFLLDVVQKYRYRQIIKREAEGSKRKAPHEAIAEDLHEMVCRFLPDRTLTYANDAYCRQFTVKCEKLIGRSFMPPVHDEDKERVNQHLDALSPENPAEKIQYRVVLPTREVRWQHWSDHAIFDDTGSLMEFQSVGWDITAKKKVEDSLQESEARYRFLVESVFDGFFVCEIESGGFLLINKKACDLLGYPMQEALQRSLWDVIAPEEQDEFREGVRSRAEQKTLSPFQDIYTLLHKDGSKFRAEVSASSVPFHGEQVIQGVLRGLAEQEGLRLQLERSRKLEGAATLSTAIAHHFNNALAEITENIGRLESDFPQNENISKYIEPMYNAAGQMSRLTSQLLAYTGSEGHRMEIISLNDTVEEIITLVRHIIDPAIQLETLLTEDVSSVMADASQIQLRLSMLLTNLTEAIEGPGRIRLSTKNEELDQNASIIHPGLKPARYACLAVEVDGKGIDKLTRDKILQCLSAKGYEGEGREMSAGDGISKEPAGWLAVVSEMETGVKVSIYFPVAESKEILRQEPSNETVAGKGFILVVEDDETGVGITRAMLEKLGFHVLEAKTGIEAIHLVRGFEGNISLAFLDTVLPDMGGLEVYSLLKEISPKTKAIVLSEYANNNLAQGILEAGADTVIEKPFTVETLTAKLKTIFEGN
jgi:PAS domain S-box-containing protein